MRVSFHLNLYHPKPTSHRVTKRSKLVRGVEILSRRSQYINQLRQRKKWGRDGKDYVLLAF